MVLNSMKKKQTLINNVRVRWYGEHIDDIFDGIVIGSSNTHYFVIPDENKDIEMKWRKDECEVL